MIDFSLILPTRERPALARRMLDSVFATAERPENVEIIAYVDHDDRASLALEHPCLSLVKLVRPRATMGAITQACYAAASGRFIMLANDDIVFRTPGWDRAVLERFHAVGDDLALVWGNDLFRGARLPSHPILSRTACELMGGVCPEQYRRDYIDAHIYDIFRLLSRIGHHRLVYMPDVVFEHLHVENGKAAADSTSVKLRRSDDEVTYIAWAEERELAAHRFAQHIAALAPTPVIARSHESVLCTPSC